MADPALFLGGGANSQSGCANLLFWKFLAENRLKMKEFGLWGHASLAPPPLDPPVLYISTASYTLRAFSRKP